MCCSKSSCVQLTGPMVHTDRFRDATLLLAPLCSGPSCCLLGVGIPPGRHMGYTELCLCGQLPRHGALLRLPTKEGELCLEILAKDKAFDPCMCCLGSYGMPSISLLSRRQELVVSTGCSAEASKYAHASARTNDP